jgi:hypothetical protein
MNKMALAHYGPTSSGGRIVVMMEVNHPNDFSDCRDIILDTGL